MLPKAVFSVDRAGEMGREIVILWSGRHTRSQWQELVDRYARKLRPMLRVADRRIRCAGGGSDEERRRREGEALLRAVPKDAWLIALDAGGRSLGSEDFAEHLRQLEESWPHEVVFVLGSDVGLDEGVLQQARETLSLGPMTMAHELARLVLYEQLYRAMTIRKGIKYHR